MKSGDWWMVACRKWAVIIGGAACVWDDVAELQTLVPGEWPGQTVAINDVGVHWPRPFEHWVSVHADKLERWDDDRRAQRPTETPALRWSVLPRWPLKRPLDGIIADPWNGGASGLLGVQVARAVECTKIILCGIPMTDTPHFEQTREGHMGNWGSALHHRRAWIQHQTKFAPYVRSMSGWTGARLGVPTREWLLGT